MTDNTLTVRDHTQPCEHEGTSDCYEWAGVWFCSAQKQGWACPGGREIVLLPANDDDPDELAGWQEQGRLWVEVSDE